MKTLLVLLLLVASPLALTACQPADEVDTATDIENMDSQPEVIVTTDSTVIDAADAAGENLEAAGENVGDAVGNAAQDAARAVDANVDLGDNAEVQGN